ncbi:hypothetical protein BGZ94_003473 [Podila epigama]|nr:hypothetical protein BGZ94_003473 [Podila epigama]
MGWASMEPDYETCGMNNWVGSFDPLMFLYFMLATVLIPYPVYLIVATTFQWEHRNKTPARHYQDIVHATSYGVIVFIFGNYAQTLKYLIAEFDFAKTSMASWKTWPFGMYALFAGATAVVLAFAAYHIYLGVILSRTVSGFVGYYVLGLLIPTILTLIGYAVLKQQNHDSLGLSKVYNWMLKLQYKQSVASARRKAQKQKQVEAAAAKQIDASAAAAAAKQIDASAAAAAASSDPDTGTVAYYGSNGVSTALLETYSVGTGSHVIRRAGSHDRLVKDSMNFVEAVAVAAAAAAATTATIETTRTTTDPNSRDTRPTNSTYLTNLVVIDSPSGTPPTELQVVQGEPEVSIQPYQPYVWSVTVPGSFHPHHWQLFYALAFFTRFDHWVSRVGGGITLGCYMQGIMAYGYDYLIEE